MRYDRLVLATGASRPCRRSAGWSRIDGRLHEQVHAFRSLDDCQRLLGPRRACPAGAAARGRRRRWAARAPGRAGAGVRGLDDRGRRGRRAPAAQPGRRARPARSSPATCAGSAPRSTPAPAPSGCDEADGLGLRLDNGFTLDTDLVVLTAGGRPSTALARGAGLTVRRGIVVDDHLAPVDDPDIHAIGDCAEHGGRTDRLRAAGLGAGRAARRAASPATT